MGAVRVHIILAFKDNYDVGSAVPNYYEVNENNRFRLVMGQSGADDVTAVNAIRWINCIDIIIAGTPPAEGAGKTVAADLPGKTNAVSGNSGSSDNADMGDKFNISEKAAPVSGSNKVAPGKSIYEITQAVALPPAQSNRVMLLITGFATVLLFCAGLWGLQKRNFLPRMII